MAFLLLCLLLLIFKATENQWLNKVGLSFLTDHDFNHGAPQGIIQKIVYKPLW